MKKGDSKHFVYVAIILFCVVILLIFIPFIFLFLKENIFFNLPIFPVLEGIESYYSALGIFVTVLSIVGAFYAVKYQTSKDYEKFREELKESEKRNRQETIDNTFFNLFEIYNNMLMEKNDDINQLYNKLSRKNFDVERFTAFTSGNLNEIEKRINLFYKKNKSANLFGMDILKLNYDFGDLEKVISGGICKKTNFDEDLNHFLYKDELIQCINKVCDSYWNNNLDKEEIIEKYNISSENIDDIVAFYNEIIDTNLKMYLQMNNDFVMDVPIDLMSYGPLTVLNEEFKNEIIKPIHQQLFLEWNINYIEKRKKNIVEKVYSENAKETGNFFRFFYRLLKYINDNKKEISEYQYRNYIGFIRGITDEKTMALIYYNAFYFREGLKLKKLLIETGFLGDKDNLKYSDEDMVVSHSYFSTETLLFENDLEILEKILNSNSANVVI